MFYIRFIVPSPLDDADDEDDGVDTQRDGTGGFN